MSSNFHLKSQSPTAEAAESTDLATVNSNTGLESVVESLTPSKVSHLPYYAGVPFISQPGYSVWNDTEILNWNAGDAYGAVWSTCSTGTPEPAIENPGHVLRFLGDPIKDMPQQAHNRAQNDPSFVDHMKNIKQQERTPGLISPSYRRILPLVPLPTWVRFPKPSHTPALPPTPKCTPLDPSSALPSTLSPSLNVFPLPPPPPHQPQDTGRLYPDVKDYKGPMTLCMDPQTGNFQHSYPENWESHRAQRAIEAEVGFSGWGNKNEDEDEEEKMARMWINGGSDDSCVYGLDEEKGDDEIHWSF